MSHYKRGNWIPERALTDKDIRWADYVFASAMVVQRESVMELVRRCKNLGVRMVAGGPLFTSEYEKFEEVDLSLFNSSTKNFFQFSILTSWHHKRQ